ncbi:MAG: SIR2 family protein [Treponema sp.]|nr:SIR2 family protein [Treponema sp.]
MSYKDFPEVQEIPSLDEYSDLLSAINEQKLVIFLGAGVSRLVGCKSWSDLAKNLLNKCLELHLLDYHEYEVISGYTDQKQKISIAYELLKEVDEEEFFKIFEEALTPSENNDQKNIYDYLNLLCDTFVTTNADECFDSKFVTNDIIYDFSNTNKVEPHKLYHIHGCKKFRSSLVFTAEQYLKRYNNEGEDNKSLTFKEFLKDLFSEYTVLFIGYGLAEFELLDYLILKAQGNKSGKQHYALKEYFSFERQLMNHDQLYYKSLNIKIIPYAKDINRFNQLIEIAKNWSTKTTLLNRMDTELEALFTKSNLLDNDINRIVSIISRDDALESFFLTLCNKRPEFTTSLIKVLYENDFFNPNKNCEWWQILQFLKTFIDYSNKDKNTHGLDILEKILLQNIGPEVKRTKSARSDNSFLEIVFSLDEKYVRDEYIWFIEDVFKNNNNFLSSHTFCFMGIPKILTYKNLNYIKRIVRVLFNFQINNTSFPYIFSKQDMSFLNEAVSNNIEKLFLILGQDLLNILFSILVTIPTEYRIIAPKNYSDKKPVFEDYYAQTLFNILLFVLKKTSNQKEILLQFTETSEYFSNLLEKALDSPEDIYKRPYENYYTYNSSTYTDEEIKCTTPEFILDLITKSKYLGINERSQNNKEVQDWIEKYAVINHEVLSQFIEIEPYFLNSFVSAFYTLVRENKDARINDVLDVLDYFTEILPQVIKYHDSDEEINRDKSFVLRNICSFVSTYINHKMQVINNDTFLKMKSIIIQLYENLKDKELTSSTVYSYNSDLLNSVSGSCFDSLFYLYACTKEKLKQEDQEIKAILSNECNEPTSSNFLTMFGKYFAYFFYYEKEWSSDTLIKLSKNKNENIIRAYWAGYFYSPYNTSKECFNFYKEKGLYNQLITLSLTDSEYYQKMADICTSAYLQKLDDISQSDSLLKTLLDKKDSKFIDALITSLILRKKSLEKKYEAPVVRIWKIIIDTIKDFKDNPEIINIKIKLLQFVELVSKINQEIYDLLQFSVIEISYYRVDHFFVSALLDIYTNNPDSKPFIEKLIVAFSNVGTFFSDYNEKFSELYKLILFNNEKAALEIANIYMQHHDHKYLEIYRGKTTMPELLNSYNPQKIKLVFHGYDLKVEEPNKSIVLNQYANSLFTSFSIDSPEFEDKQGIFVFTVNGTVVYVGKTETSLKTVMQSTYQNINVRKLQADGQRTACRLNAFLNENHNKNIELWFIECNDKEKIKRIKKELINEYKPEINKR